MMRKNFKNYCAAGCAAVLVTMSGCTYSIDTHPEKISETTAPQVSTSQSVTEKEISSDIPETKNEASQAPETEITNLQPPETSPASEADITETEVSEETEAVTEPESEAPVETEELTEIEDETKAIAENTISEAELRSLFEENLYCMKNVFMADHLAYSDEAIADDHIHMVTDERFADYREFEAYVRDIYCAAEADRLLYNYPYDGTRIYIEHEGTFCIDSHYANAKGYFVDWTSMEVTIGNADSERCEFSVTGYIQEPSDTPVQEEYTVSGAAVFENGEWVLEKMLY